MILVSLDDFLRTGTLGPIRLGVPRAQVRIVLGDPSVQSAVNRRQRLPMTWKYGDVELSFAGDDDRLIGIYLDNFGVPRGAGGLALDPGVFGGGLPLDEVEAALRAAGISFSCRPWPTYPHDVPWSLRLTCGWASYASPTSTGRPLGYIT